LAAGKADDSEFSARGRVFNNIRLLGASSFFTVPRDAIAPAAMGIPIPVQNKPIALVSLSVKRSSAWHGTRWSPTVGVGGLALG
jgi:hypothetical protein